MAGYTAGSVKVTGLRELIKACDASDTQLVKGIRERLQKAADHVAQDVQRRYSPFSAKGAAGVKGKVTKPGNAIVAQTLRKTRPPRARGNFGGLVFAKAFLPAVDANQPIVEGMFSDLIDAIGTDNWE